MKYCALILCTLIPLSTATICDQKITANISYGELVDKITILMIKSERITDPNKLRNIFKELHLLQETFNISIGNREDISELMQRLKEINEALWDVEDILRTKERIREFGDEFLQLARSVYKINDQRSIIKRSIDILLGSEIMEEKSYDSLTYD
jgi:uncharacterized coiled-coil DUF342 family protein